MSLAELIRARRTEMGLSQVQLGVESDLNQRTISELETGARRRPTLRVLTQLAHALDLPIEQLVMASGHADSLEGAKRLAQEVLEQADDDPALSALLLDWKHLDDGARGVVTDVVRALRKNQEAIERRFREAGDS